MKTTHAPYRPMFTSTETERLLDSPEVFTPFSPLGDKVAFGIKALDRLGEKLLDVSCHLGMLHTMLQAGLDRTIYATDDDEYAIGNILGHAHFLLRECGFIAGAVCDLLVMTKDAPLQGFDLADRLWNLRSTTAMVEAFANNTPDSGGERLSSDEAIQVCVAVSRIIDAADDISDDGQRAKEFLRSLKAEVPTEGRGVADAVTPPTRPAGKPRKTSQPAAEVMA